MNAYLLAALLLVQTDAAPPQGDAQQAGAPKKAEGDEVICKKKIVRGEGLLTNVRTRKICKTREEWDHKSSGE